MTIEIKTGDDALDSTLANPKVVEAIEGFIKQNESGLVNKRDELLTTVSEQKRVIEQINQLGGVDKFNDLVTQAQQAEEAAKTAKLKEAEAAGDITALKNAHAEQVKSLNEQIEVLKNTAVTKEVNAQVANAIASAKGIPDLLTPMINGRVRGTYLDNGEIAVEVLASNGNPLLTAEGQNGTLNDLLSEIKSNEIFASAFQGVGSSGMSTQQSGNVDVSGGVNYFDEKGGNFNLTEGMKLAKTNPEKAKAMMAEAGVDISKYGL